MDTRKEKRLILGGIPVLEANELPKAQNFARTVSKISSAISCGAFLLLTFITHTSHVAFLAKSCENVAMGMFTSTKRIIRAGFINFWRNALVSLSAIFVMTIALFVVGATMLSSVFLDSALEEIKSKVDVNIYFNPDVIEADIYSMKTSLEALPEVKSVEYISREKAIENFKVRHGNDYLMTQALEELVDNPLGAILNIRAKDTSQYEAIAKHIKAEQEAAGPGANLVYNVNYSKNKVVIDKLTSITRGVERVSFAMLIVLVGIAVVSLSIPSALLSMFLVKKSPSCVLWVQTTHSYAVHSSSRE